METSSTPMELDSFHTCGICGKAITDQGVLDCCQHLFCFSCIDDWASVTNLCPICKLRFRLITCLPGRSAQPSSEQESASDRRRDDDQLGPSFYIDEEAVTCLEGDECLVRSGKAFEVEADDTSVACDSCDCWYHAGCVGFDTSGCTQESWWCPRCVRGTDANPGTHSASKQSAAAVVLDPAGFQAQTAVEITACIQQRNNHEATTLETQPPLPPSESRMSKSTPLTTSDTTEDKNPRKRRRTDVEIATAVDLPDSDRNVQGVQGLIVRSSTKGISQSTCTNSNDLQEKARSPQTGGHEAADDLLEIVKDPGYRVAEADEGGGYKSPRSAGENAVRTRIIMHRAESGESSVVEQIRQQMRNAAGYGAAEDLGQVDLSDGRFLAAYRAAVAAKDKADVQSKRSVQKGSSWVIKALTRGTSVRDKLTRKLYGGTSTRRTWDRDWDVAFWKGGRGASKKCCDNKVPPESTSEQTDPAADKVYLADSSLFARKDDNDPPDAPDSDCRFTVDLCHMNLSDKVLGKGPLIDCRGNGQQFSQQHIGPYSKSKSRKDLAGASSATPLAKLDVNDKRKWALEVLARKKGELGPAGSLDSKHEKGQSLVDFLPLELRPSIDISLSSKIPSAVRQVQLNRILEHELRSCGVRRNPRSVKCQQAIAAAVSKEQKIFEKSNTKGVYVNLCARATSKSTSTEKVKVNLTAASSSTDCKVREALQAAGLLSDSDSDSPPVNLVESSCLTSEFKEEKPSQKVHSRISDEGNGTSPIPVSAQSDGVASQELPGRSSMTPEVLSLDLHREQPSLGAEIFCSSPLYLDEDFGLDDEELETPMIIGHTASTGQKDGTSKVKVVLTTFNKFKHAPASTEAETEAAKPETLIGDLDNGVARCNGTESAEAVCRDTSSGAAVEGTVDNDCMLLAGPVVDAKVIDSDCLVNPTQAEVVTMASESAETHATSSEGQHEAPKLNGLRGASVELEEGLDACKDNLSASPKSRTVDTPSDAILEGRKACEKIVVTTTEDRDVAGEADLDDWMKVGKFPNLESRIEEVRTRVLKKSTGVLTKLLTKYPTSAPNDLEGSCVGIEGVDTECTLNEKDMEESLDGLDVAHQSEAKAANPSIQKQVHSYVREHLRPLFKSGVITAKEYQWATAKTASKVMQYHPGAKSAAFLIAEGSKVKKLAEDYLQAFTQRKS